MIERQRRESIEKVPANLSSVVVSHRVNLTAIHAPEKDDADATGVVDEGAFEGGHPGPRLHAQRAHTTRDLGPASPLDVGDGDRAPAHLGPVVDLGLLLLAALAELGERRHGTGTSRGWSVPRW